jgi:hypothetical protein
MGSVEICSWIMADEKRLMAFSLDGEGGYNE